MGSNDFSKVTLLKVVASLYPTPNKDQNFSKKKEKNAYYI